MECLEDLEYDGRVFVWSAAMCVCVLGVVMENEGSTFFALYKTSLIVLWHTPRDIHKASVLLKLIFAFMLFFKKCTVLCLISWTTPY